MYNHSDLLYILMFVLCSNCRILLVRSDVQSQIVFDNSSVVMFTSKTSSSSYSVVDSGDNGANGFQVDDRQSHEEQQYLDILMSALNITKLPDIAKANISQHEYATKYREYLDLIYKREVNLKFEARSLSKVKPPVLHSIRYQSKRLLRRKRTAGKSSPPSSLHVYFPLNITNHHDFQSMGIEEANVRLLLHFRKIRRKKNNPSKKEHKRLLIKIYQVMEDKQRVLLDEKKIAVDKITKSQKSATVSHWLQFDVTKAVDDWLNGRVANKGLEIECDRCHRAGARIIDNIIFSDSSESSYSDSDLTPVLNIVSRMGETFREKRSRHHHTHQSEHLSSLRRTTDCSATEKRCCRHPMNVNFTEIRGYEFIIQPKYIDAGYCHGRCPPRYLPSNHHAILQSLIWKENKYKVPKLTCAPHKLSDLDVLHLDEHDDTKLKISTWTNMIVLDCACS